MAIHVYIYIYIYEMTSTYNTRCGHVLYTFHFQFDKFVLLINILFALSLNSWLK